MPPPPYLTLLVDLAIAVATTTVGPPQAPPLAPKPPQAPALTPAFASVPPGTAPAGFEWVRDVRGVDGKIHPWGLRAVARDPNTIPPPVPRPTVTPRPFVPRPASTPGINALFVVAPNTQSLAPVRSARTLTGATTAVSSGITDCGAAG